MPSLSILSLSILSCAPLYYWLLSLLFLPYLPKAVPQVFKHFTSLRFIASIISVTSRILFVSIPANMFLGRRLGFLDKLLTNSRNGSSSLTSVTPFATRNVVRASIRGYITTCSEVSMVTAIFARWNAGSTFCRHNRIRSLFSTFFGLSSSSSLLLGDFSSCFFGPGLRPF